MKMRLLFSLCVMVASCDPDRTGTAAAKSARVALVIANASYSRGSDAALHGGQGCSHCG